MWILVAFRSEVVLLLRHNDITDADTQVRAGGWAGGGCHAQLVVPSPGRALPAVALRVDPGEL